MKKAKIISIINYKGGVGKTVSAFNIAAGLNFLNNNSVLLIDLDPQCSLSTICMKAYSKTAGEYRKFSQLGEEETINHVFRTYLNEDIVDFDLPLDLDKLIKKDFYKSDQCHLKNFDFIPATMLVSSRKGGVLAGLEDIDGDIRRSYGDGANSQLKRLSILGRFLNDTKLDEIYDFIIFDCPPTNNYVTQNALFVSSHYLVPTMMDEMGIRGADHVRNIIEKKDIFDLCRSYDTLIRMAPESSYLSYLKSGVPEMIGIIETLKKSATNTDQLRATVESRFSNMLFNSVIENQIEISRLTGNGECCFEKTKTSTKVKPNEMYALVVFELLDRLGVTKSDYARGIKDFL